MNKKLRLQVYEKCKGRCGYCGKCIEYKDMQVDHIWPRCGGFTILDDKAGYDMNVIDNLMPSCRRCNHYKRAHTLTEFRKLMISLHERLAKVYILNVAVQFGMCEVKPFDGVFYFEKMAATVEQ